MQRLQLRAHDFTALPTTARYDQHGTAAGISGDTAAAQRVPAAALCRQPARHGAATLPPMFD